MPISSPSSKKCSTARPVSLLTRFAATVALTITTVPAAYGGAPSQAGPALPAEISQAIHRASVAPVPASFEPALAELKTRYMANEPSCRCSIWPRDTSRPDPERYIALMGAARIGGRLSAHRITPFLKSPAWLLRSGALQALTDLRDPATGPATFAAAQRPRPRRPNRKAVAAIQALHPPGAAEALIQALGAGQNYSDGKALWVPGRALAAIQVLKAVDYAPRLLPLLDHVSDPTLQIQTVATLEALTGRRLKPGTPLRERVRQWKHELILRRLPSTT